MLICQVCYFILEVEAKSHEVGCDNFDITATQVKITLFITTTTTTPTTTTTSTQYSFAYTTGVV